MYSQRVLEEQVLTYIAMNNPSAVLEVTSDDFLYHRDVYIKARAMYEKSGSVDYLELYSTTNMKDFEDDQYMHTFNVIKLFKMHARKVRAARRVADMNKALANLEDIDDVNRIIMEFTEDIAQLVESVTTKDDSYAATLDRAYENLLDGQDPREREKYMVGIPIIDLYMLGAPKGELTAIAAHSGVGKTAFALEMAFALAERGHKVLFASREMLGEQLAKRTIISHAGINGTKMRHKTFTKKEWAQMEGFIREKSGLKLYFDDRTSRVADLHVRCMKEKFDVLIVDYIQILTPNQSEQNREKEVAAISRGLLQIAQGLGIPVIALSQLNDESRDFRPSGERDMRESKAIYHDSNNVIFLHKPTVDKEIKRLLGRSDLFADDFDNDEYDIIEVIVAKQRDGRTGSVPMKYYKDYLRFMPLDKKPTFTEYKSIKIKDEFKVGGETDAQGERTEVS